MKYYFKSIFILFIINAIAVFPVSLIAADLTSNQMVVVIDPGHGGKDPGAVNKSIREKDVVLGVGLKLGNLIKENFPDVKVIFTRSSDVFIPLIERSRIANKNKADLFISIHANTCGTPSTHGTETFVLGLHRSNENLDVAKKENSVILMEDNYTTTYEGFDPNSSESYIMFELVQDLYMDQSLSFADDIQQQFQSRLSSVNRGVKQAGFLVLRQSSMPSVLIETGFLSNQNEANYLKSEEGQLSLAKSVFEAFQNFKSKSSGNSSTAQKKNNKSDSAKDREVVDKTAIVKKEIADQPDGSSSELSSKEIASTKNSKIGKTKENEEQKISEATDSAANTKISDTVLNSENTFYSVQIAASTSSVEPISSNFKGLKEVRREKTDKYYRFYVGRESTIENTILLLNRIKQKFPQAFIVSFVDGNRTVLKPGSY